MEIHYDSLAALAAVVREGSFDSAARSLEVTQSAVSQRIKLLEEKVGTVLIVRGRPCVPTEAGLQLCQHFQQVTLLQYELEERLGSLTEGVETNQATIRISVNSDSLATWFPKVIQRATNELNVRFEIIPDDQEHTEHSLKSGEALAVVTAIENRVQGCRRISLGAMEYMAVASNEFINEHFSDKISLQAILKAPSLAFDRKDTLPEQWMALLFGEKVTPKRHMIPSYEGYLACCLNGSGWGMMPTVTVEPLVDLGRLSELVPGKRIHVSLHWQSSTQSSVILRQIGDIVAEEAHVHLLPDNYRL